LILLLFVNCDSGFGWLKDPLLEEVQKLLNIIQSHDPNNTAIPWTSAVPGASTNWTSEDDVRRRRNPDVFKTGKKNKNQIGQYVSYNNMTELQVCVVPMDSQNTSQYVEGEQFPACELFQYEWTDKQAYDKGFRKPFGSDYANRIWGTDAKAFGRPVRTDYLAVYLSDIYRSSFVQYQRDETWFDITTRRFSASKKDMENATQNPENIQYYAFGPAGLENTSQAVGIPAFVSFPHFLHGDPSLVAAVEGLSPNADTHDSYLDVEPQTGLLVNVRNRIQVSYQMKSKKFPQNTDDSEALAHSLCQNVSEIVATLQQFGVIDNTTSIDCELVVFTDLYNCFNAPMDWQFYRGEIFFPYGWVDEHFTLPESDADQVRNSLLYVDDFAVKLRFWSLLTAGVLFVMILSMLYRGYLDMLAKDLTIWHYFDESPSAYYKKRDSELTDSNSSGTHFNCTPVFECIYTFTPDFSLVSFNNLFIGGRVSSVFQHCSRPCRSPCGPPCSPPSGDWLHSLSLSLSHHRNRRRRHRLCRRRLPSPRPALPQACGAPCSRWPAATVVT
jgi:hypothetical protein